MDYQEEKLRTYFIKTYGYDLYEECPCGSRVKIKYCKHDDNTSKREMIDQLLKIYRDKRKCLYPGCDEIAIYSHTLSKSTFLLNVLNEKTLITFEPRRTINNNIYYKIVEKGAQKLTTFYGFCSKHDSDLFKTIDNDFDFIKPTDLQLYVLSLRILAFQINTEETKVISCIHSFTKGCKLFLNVPIKNNLKEQSGLIASKLICELLEKSYEKILRNNIKKYYLNNQWIINPKFNKIIIDSQLQYDGFVSHYAKYQHSDEHIINLDVEAIKQDIVDNYFSLVTFPIFELKIQRTYIITSSGNILIKNYFNYINSLNLEDKINYLNQLFRHIPIETTYFSTEYYNNILAPLYKNDEISRIDLSKIDLFMH